MPDYFETGFSMGIQAWHGLMNVIPSELQLSVEEALQAAALDWEVGLLPLCVAEGADYRDTPIEVCDELLQHIYSIRDIHTNRDPEEKPINLEISERIDEIAKLINGWRQEYVGEPVRHRATYRVTDGSILGVVGPNYTPLQNIEAFQWFQPFLDAEECRFETAGSLKGGQRVWVLAKIQRNDMEVAKGDYVTKYILLSNSHDGSTAVRLGFTPIRVVCWNTLSMAHSNQASQLIRIRHCSGVKDQMENVREIMNLANQQFEATAEQYRLLANRNINAADLHKYVKLVLNVKEEDDQIKTRTRNIMERVFELFETGKGSEFGKDTYWNAYNAVTEYLNYERGRTDDSRLTSLWYGDSFNMNQRALTTALEMVA